MSVEPKPDVSEFADVADALHDQRVHSEQVVRRALSRAGDRFPDRVSEELNSVSRAVDCALDVVDRAVEGLRAQNDALFAARTELEGAHAQFCDFFELAPAAYIVTTPDTRILYANQAACALLGRQKNELAGRLLIGCVPLEHRTTFRAALLRSSSPGMVSDWPATLLSTDAGGTNIVC